MIEKYEQEYRGFNAILNYIALAQDLGQANESLRILAIVSGSETDRDNWEHRLQKTNRHLFNRNGSTQILSIQEKIGKKTRMGNFLGTLFAFQVIKERTRNRNIDFKEYISLVGMLIGRGERMSPFTQIEGDRKPAIKVSSAHVKIAGKSFPLTAIEEALYYFVPVAKLLEKRGFRGVLNKWGDETQIPSVDIDLSAGEDRSLQDYDIIKFISVARIVDELAEQKDWVVYDDLFNVITQLPRNRMEVLLGQLESLGIRRHKDGAYYAGLSLGPVAVSYPVLEIACDVFREELEREGVSIDFDPYFIMALTMDGNPSESGDAGNVTGLTELLAMVPDFFSKVNAVKVEFTRRYGRELRVKAFDLGSNLYWADIGQHRAMREKFLSLNGENARGYIARTLEKIPHERDAGGNIILNSTVSPDVKVRNSVIINSVIRGTGTIEGSVVKDSELNDPDLFKSFAVLSVRPAGKVGLKEDSGIYGSIGHSDFVLDRKMRAGTLLLDGRTLDLFANEDLNLRDRANNYLKPVEGNPISFHEAFESMFGVSMDELEKRRFRLLQELQTDRRKPLERESR
jgi:hypothetical protein